MSYKEVTTCLGYQQITALTTATALTIPVVDPVSGTKMMPTFCIVLPESQAVRWRDDGVPTASVGMPLAVGQPLKYDGDLTRIKFIEQTASAKINISYYV